MRLADSSVEEMLFRVWRIRGSRRFMFAVEIGWVSYAVEWLVRSRVRGPKGWDVG